MKTKQKDQVKDSSWIDEKIRICQEFRKDLRIRVDEPLQGSANTNSGNTNRTFFRNSSYVTEITGLIEILISRFQTIIEAISCDQPVDAKKFDSYARETAHLYIQLYSWLPMALTMHNILLHDGKVIEYFIVLIGQLIEEEAESCNKHYKQLQTCSRFARTCSME
ncbi:uncharacterized protein DMENIID0001_168090 [Sergentomyia squamirostris]